MTTAAESVGIVLANLVGQTARLELRADSLEDMRDEHQRQLLELGGLFSQMQDSMLNMVHTIATQQRTISLLIDEYQHTVGEAPPALLASNAAGDELAVRRDGER